MARVSEFNWDRFGDNLISLDRFVAVDDLVIGRQQQLDPQVSAPLFDLPGRLQHVILNQRFADRESFRFQKCVSHCAAN